jgi:transposase
VERVETSGLRLFEVAAEVGVHESQLRRWARQFDQSDALTVRRRPSREVPGPSPADLAVENACLKRELQRAGIEILEVTAPDRHDRRRRGKDDDLDAEKPRTQPSPASAPSRREAVTAWSSPCVSWWPAARRPWRRGAWPCR